MIPIPASAAQKRFPDLLDVVTRDRLPVRLTSPGKPAAILLDAGEYASMTSTLHLLSTPANAARIAEGLSHFAELGTIPAASEAAMVSGARHQRQK